MTPPPFRKNFILGPSHLFLCFSFLYCVARVFDYESHCAMPIRDVDCDTVDGVTIVGGYGLMQSEGCACASTMDTSRCVDGCDRPVESSIVDTSWRVNGCDRPVASSPVSSGWRFSIGGGMRLIHETCATVSVDLLTRRNW